MGDANNRIRNTKPKDSSAKLIFDDHVLCAQFLQDYVDVGILRNVEPEDIEDISERFLWIWQENRDSDSVKKIRIKDVPGMEEVYVIAMIDHQSKVDYDMSFRTLRYSVQIWTDYAQEQEAKRKGATKLKDFRYPPILPVVFYDGSGGWTASADFKERVYLGDVLGEYIPSFRYMVVRLSGYSNQELLDKRNELSLIMLVDKLRSAADFQTLKDIPEEYFEDISQKAPETVLKLIGKIISVLLLRLNVPKGEVEEFTDRIERREFHMLFENFEAYDVQETRRVSKAEGKAEDVLELLEELGPVPEKVREQIMKEQDLPTLSKWHKAAAKAGSVECFLEEMGLE